MANVEEVQEPAQTSHEQLQAELDQVLADLEDLKALRHGFLGQTGVHIGMRLLRQVTAQLDSEEAKLQEQREQLRALMQSTEA